MMTRDSKLYCLASYAADLFSFVSANENLSRYFEMARAIRARMTESDHQQLELAAEGLVEEVFSVASDRRLGLPTRKIFLPQRTSTAYHKSNEQAPLQEQSRIRRTGHSRLFGERGQLG